MSGLRMNKLGVTVLALAALLFPLGVALSAEISPALITSVTCDELYQAMRDRAAPVVVDVRGAAEYNVSHIKGAASLPYYNTALAAWSRDAALVLYCSGTGCPLANNSAVVLMRAGYTSVKVLKGGLNDWELKNYPMFHSATKTNDPSACKPVQAKELSKWLAERTRSLTLLDVRPAAEYRAGHLHGSKNVSETSSDISGTVKSGAMAVVIDRDAARARKVCTILTDSGLNVRILSGGPAVWSALKYPLETGAGDGN